jgi:hypothetical protein
MSSVTPCLRQFILHILCGNPILKGTFVTTLSGMILTLDAEITLLTAQVGRLNIINQLANIEIQTLNAITNKLQAQLNLLLGPLADASACPEVAAFLQQLQSSSVSKIAVGVQNQIYKANKSLNLAAAQNALIAQKQKLRTLCLDTINEIANLCP